MPYPVFSYVGSCNVRSLGGNLQGGNPNARRVSISPNPKARRVSMSAKRAMRSSIEVLKRCVFKNSWRLSSRMTGVNSGSTKLL